MFQNTNKSISASVHFIFFLAADYFHVLDNDEIDFMNQLIQADAANYGLLRSYSLATLTNIGKQQHLADDIDPLLVPILGSMAPAFGKVSEKCKEASRSLLLDLFSSRQKGLLAKSNNPKLRSVH